PAAQPIAAAARQAVKPVYKKEMIKKEPARKTGTGAAGIRKDKPGLQESKNRGRSLDERLKYYKEKYGEKYTAPPEVIAAEKKGKKDKPDKKTGKKSLFKRISSIFKK
ncbi:MAG: hypothetical protein RBT69_08640, partial [Spirochaetia bacterium]|nr:hypothetical protein [Spirochaetia bacterium]